MDVGVRVIRGRNWSWDDQDGNFVGTVVKPFESSANAIQNGTVFVQWDNGFIGNYRVGKDGEYDLRIFDSGPAGIKSTAYCDECKTQVGIIGTRWKCAVCHDYDLCHACYHGDKHDLLHHFIRYDSRSEKGVEVPSRAKSEKSEVLGIFPGTTVVRRVEDWLHGQNDGGMGGMLGTVLEDPPQRQLTSNRGTVLVQWENGDTVEHSCGNDGKVALKCVGAVAGKEYYVQHLADLSADQFRVAKFREEEEDESASRGPSGEMVPIEPRQSIDNNYNGSAFISPFRPGDRVQVNMSASVFRSLQDGQPGGWNAEMEMCIGATGVVLKVYQGVIVVGYKGLKKMWPINPEALTKKLFDVGDRVRILTDEQRVQMLQKDHGGWVQKMKEDLGQVAEVVGTSNGGRVDVKVGDKPYRWTLNVLCCTLVEESNSETGFQESSDSDDTDSDPGASAMSVDDLLSQRPDLIRPERLVEFAQKNKVQLVKAILQKYPDVIDMKTQDKTALHVACLKGHVATVRVLLDAGADITVTDKDGNTPVHYAVHKRDEAQVLELLLGISSAYGDHMNFKLTSVLQMAVQVQNPHCVQLLVQHGSNVNVQDQCGDTPLHDAITVGQRDVIEALVNCPRFNFSIMNDRGFNVLQLAAFKGDCFTVELLVKRAQHLVNEQKGDGFTALHIACINDHRDAADVLISKGYASTELKNREQHTPLMIALSRAKVATLELLVLKGANLNTCDRDGETCLHWVLKLITSIETGQRDRQQIPTVDLNGAPQIASVVTRLPAGIGEPTWVGVASFLLQHGADLYQSNNAGISPIQILQNQTITDVLLEAQQRSQRNVNPQRKDPFIPRQLNTVYPKMT